MHAGHIHTQAHGGLLATVPAESDGRLAESQGTDSVEGEGGGGGAAPEGEVGGGAQGTEGGDEQEVQEAAEEDENEDEDEDEDEDEEGLELAMAPGTATGYKGVYVFKVADGSTWYRAALYKDGRHCLG